jgi:L-threonylcarbamoyladenylate synthase
MLTEILKPCKATYDKCAKLVKEGFAVAFPTETVYGLGANALSDESIKRIFEAKNRPCDNPLTVHLADKKDILLVASEIPSAAEKLIESFMPGPLTIILKKRKEISALATAGLDTVGVRIPSSAVAKEFIKACGLPIAAPSANLSSRPSPTTAMHVYEDLNGRIPAIIDGGRCEIGIESTVIDASGDGLKLLRVGGISEKQITDVCGEILQGKAADLKSGKYRHYAPKCPCKLLDSNDTEYIKREYLKYTGQGKKAALLCYDENAKALCGLNIISLGKDNISAAATLFNALRQAESAADIILIEKPKTGDLESVLIDRISKACGNT